MTTSSLAVRPSARSRRWAWCSVGAAARPRSTSAPRRARCLKSLVWLFDLASASAWLRDRLAEPATPGVLTVVWQSITEQ